MKAAVLHTLGKPPHFEDFTDPQPGQGEVLVHVKAASLKNVEKAMASGSGAGASALRCWYVKKGRSRNISAVE